MFSILIPTWNNLALLQLCVRSIRDNSAFPTMVAHMVGVGEETGNLDGMLEKIADFYEDEVAAAVKALTSILEPIMRAHGVAWGTPGLKAASLDHAMWWHRDGRVDEWVLYEQESPVALGGRGLSFGRIFSRDGTLLATVAQEGMVRVPTA